MAFIPVNEPLLDGNEKKYLVQCVETGWISSEGPFVQQFEKNMAAKVGRKHGVAVCNGTAALDIAVAALELAPGDEVIMPAFTIISCISEIVRAGIVPVLVETDPRTWNMDIGQVEAKITPRTKAILMVHIYGLPVDADPILNLAKQHGLKVIEDAAEMIGQTYKGRACGSLGDISIFSFYPNKHITTGEGGMVLSDDDRLAERCRSLRNLCFKADRRFAHDQHAGGAGRGAAGAAGGIRVAQASDGQLLQQGLCGPERRAVAADRHRLCREYLLGLRHGAGR